MTFFDKLVEQLDKTVDLPSAMAQSVVLAAADLDRTMHDLVTRQPSLVVIRRSRLIRHDRNLGRLDAGSHIYILAETAFDNDTLPAAGLSWPGRDMKQSRGANSFSE